MRLWSLHPRYLDSRGLVALWREALLAQAVLGGRIRGYTRHPRFLRFRSAPAPAAAIANYLRAVHAEAARRSYHFDAGKIARGGQAEPIPVTRAQLDYEWGHLRIKLKNRYPSWLATFKVRSRPRPHPLFCLVRGPVEVWEIIPPRRSQAEKS
ncbi:MAG: pyrimidine dimer DNA glycosylase/endonuclease V [Gammaproteobacteria bacterium]